MKRLLTLSISLIIWIIPYTALAFSQDPVISAWLPNWDTVNGRAALERYAPVLDEISFFWYNLNPDGTLEIRQNAEDQSWIDLAHQYDVKVVTTITNNFSGVKAHAVLSDPNLTNALIQNILAKIDQFGYDGIDIDFEGLKLEDKDAFTQFLTDLSGELHQRNLLLTVAVQAKTSYPGLWDTLKAQDWEAIGKVVDRFRIMTYDYHYSGSVPGPVSPVPWIRDVANYAETEVAADKIVMGMPFYGYNWPNNGEVGSGANFTNVQDWLEQYGVSIGWDDYNKEPYFAYFKSTPTPEDPNATTERIVWFQNAQSIRAKVQEIKTHAVAGVTVWRLGSEDPDNLTVFQEELRSPVTAPFSDVPSTHWAYNFVMTLKGRGISAGIDGAYFPDNFLNRAEAIKMILLKAKLPMQTLTPLPFSDLEPSDWPYPFVQTAFRRNIVSGFQDNTFLPYLNVTRAQAVKMLLNTFNVPLITPTKSTFSDVPTNHWAFSYIETAKSIGILSGYADGTFHPEHEIKRDEFAKILANIGK